MTEQVDALVIGGSMRGLVTTYVLQSLGFRTVLIERANAPGGADRSFTTPDGTTFDFGLHVLDYLRSDVATKLFTHVTRGEVHQVTLKRGMVLRGASMPYAPAVEHVPPAVAELLREGELVDDIGSALPTRDRLASVYGSGFADLIFDDVLPSYPCEARHLAFDVDESELLGNIYPWFFPRATRAAAAGDESRAFHDLLRQGLEQQILYPRNGGFGGFADAFLQSFDPELVEVLTGATDLDIQVDPDTQSITSAATGGRQFAAPHVFWASGWAPLCGLLDIPCQQTATDQILLGSFRFDRPADTPFHELLVGDSSMRSNRIYFPARFRESDEPLVQVEFGFPVAEARDMTPEVWRDQWIRDFRTIGIIGDEHRVEEFDFKTFAMHFNAFGMEGERLVDADPTLINPRSNIRPVIPSLANLNLNRYVPRAVRYVAAVAAAGAEGAGDLLRLAHPTS